MHDADADLRRDIALFRYGLIVDLAQLPPGAPGIGEQVRAKAAQHHTIPGTHRTRVAAGTIRDWLHRYRLGGFDALYPKPRSDCGQLRRLPPEAAELELTRFRGHIKSEDERREYDGENASSVSTGVPPADGRADPCRPHAGGPGAGV